MLFQEIFKRLGETHAKSSSGGLECKSYDPKKPVGYGLRMFPEIDGLDTRFSGSGNADADLEATTDRLRSTQTIASQARLDKPRILLYPECTKMMNDPGRLRLFQERGEVVKQADLARREKWYN